MITFKHHWDKDVVLTVSQERFDSQCATFQEIKKLAIRDGLALSSGHTGLIFVHPDTQRADGYYEEIQAKAVCKLSDTELDALYYRLAKLAEQAGLIRSASGGVVLILHPSHQLHTDQYHVVQVMSGNQKYFFPVVPQPVVGQTAVGQK